VCEVNDQSGPLDNSALSSLTTLQIAGLHFSFCIPSTMLNFDIPSLCEDSSGARLWRAEQQVTAELRRENLILLPANPEELP